MAKQPNEKPADTATEKPNGGITLEQAAALLKVTPRRVQQLVSEGWIKKASSRGGYALVAVVHGYIDFLQDEARRTSKSAAQSRVQDARARQIELATAKDEGRLIETDDVVATFADILGTFRSELSGVPAGATRDLKQRAIIEDLMNGAFDRCQKQFSRARANLENGRGFGLEDEA